MKERKDLRILTSNCNHLVVECQPSQNGKNCSAMAESDGMTRAFVIRILDADVVRLAYVRLPLRGQWKHTFGFECDWIRVLVGQQKFISSTKNEETRLTVYVMHNRRIRNTALG